VNGQPFSTPGLIGQDEQAAPGAPLTLSGVHANGQAFSYVVTPKCDTTGCHVGIGIPRQLNTVPSAVINGVEFPFVAIGGIVQGLGSLISGQVPGGLLGPQGLTGPIGIANTAREAVNAGPPTYVLLAALLSVALGFTNLLPLLALDGGRIVVVVVEALRRRPFDRAAELNLQRIGLVALMGIAVVITFLDIQRIATGQFPGLR